MPVTLFKSDQQSKKVSRKDAKARSKISVLLRALASLREAYKWYTNLSRSLLERDFEAKMKCPYCSRRVRMFTFDRHRPLRLFLPRCHSCHRYVVTWLHAVIFGLLAAAAIILLIQAL
jgi:hypothetical protein